MFTPKRLSKGVRRRSYIWRNIDDSPSYPIVVLKTRFETCQQACLKIETHLFVLYRDTAGRLYIWNVILAIMHRSRLNTIKIIVLD